MELVASLENRSVFRNQGKRPLLQLEPGAFFDSYLGPFGGAAEGREHRHIGIEPHAVIAPVSGCDHSSVKVEDPLKLFPVERRNGTPVPRMRKRRDDAQALLTLGLG